MTVSDRELLELAAKAIGGSIFGAGDLVVFKPDSSEDFASYWNPLTDDGDALRLAVKLGLRISTGSGSDDRKMTEVINGYGIRAVEHGRAELHGDDPMAATRRAIVRAAAHIGGVMP